VNVFLVPKLEVGYGVVADLSDEWVVVCGTLTENFFRQTVDELVQRFYVKCGVKKGDVCTGCFLGQSGRSVALTTHSI
jgi:hypothetical protein